MYRRIWTLANKITVYNYNSFYSQHATVWESSTKSINLDPDGWDLCLSTIKYKKWILHQVKKTKPFFLQQSLRDTGIYRLLGHPKPNQLRGGQNINIAGDFLQLRATYVCQKTPEYVPGRTCEQKPGWRLCKSATLPKMRSQIQQSAPGTTSSVGTTPQGLNSAVSGSLPTNCPHIECKWQIKLENKVLLMIEFFLAFARLRLLIVPQCLMDATAVVLSDHFPIG